MVAVFRFAKDGNAELSGASPTRTPGRRFATLRVNQTLERDNLPDNHSSNLLHYQVNSPLSSALL